MEQKDEAPLALNGTQKSIIKATLKLYLDDIRALEPTLARKALEAIKADEISFYDERIFRAANVYESIEFIRKIMQHPCPQNRAENYPYFDPPKDESKVVYKDEQGKPAFEDRGLLSLSARNDKTAPPVTRFALLTYISELINKLLKKVEKQELQSRADEQSPKQTKTKYYIVRQVGLTARQASDTRYESIDNRVVEAIGNSILRYFGKKTPTEVTNTHAFFNKQYVGKSIEEAKEAAQKIEFDISESMNNGRAFVFEYEKNEDDNTFTLTGLFMARPKIDCTASDYLLPVKTDIRAEPIVDKTFGSS